MTEQKTIYGEEMSQQEKLREVDMAFSNAFPSRDSVAAPAPSSWYPWIVATFDDFLIIEVSNKYYKVSYSREDDEFIFAPFEDWEEVEKLEEWATKPNHLKAISESETELRVGNYIGLFGGRDLTWVLHGPNRDGTKGEFFVPETEFESDYTKIGRVPIDFEHGEKPDGFDSPGRHDVLGYVDWSTAKKDKKGLWVQRAIFRQHRYYRIIKQLIDDGLMGTSSEVVPGEDEVDATGKIVKWPIYRDTLTLTPMEPRMLDENKISQIKSLFTDAGLEVPEALLEGEKPKKSAAEEEGVEEQNKLTDDEQCEIAAVITIERKGKDNG